MSRDDPNPLVWQDPGTPGAIPQAPGVYPPAEGRPPVFQYFNISGDVRWLPFGGIANWWEAQWDSRFFTVWPAAKQHFPGKALELRAPRCFIEGQIRSSDNLWLDRTWQAWFQIYHSVATDADEVPMARAWNPIDDNLREQAGAFKIQLAVCCASWLYRLPVSGFVNIS